jgi:hypothetical protein
MQGWDRWKKGFDRWESTTAEVLEKVLTNRAVLTPAGAVLTATMRAKAARRRALATLWSSLGLPTRRDQERTLHLLNQLESRLLDLEEKLEEAERGNDAGPGRGAR